MQDVEQKELPSLEAALDHAKVLACAHRTLLATPQHLNVAISRSVSETAAEGGAVSSSADDV